MWFLLLSRILQGPAWTLYREPAWGFAQGRVSEQEAQVAQGGREQPELELSLKR